MGVGTGQRATRTKVEHFTQGAAGDGNDVRRVAGEAVANDQVTRGFKRYRRCGASGECVSLDAAFTAGKAARQHAFAAVVERASGQIGSAADKHTARHAVAENAAFDAGAVSGDDAAVVKGTGISDVAHSAVADDAAPAADADAGDVGHRAAGDRAALDADAEKAPFNGAILDESVVAERERGFASDGGDADVAGDRVVGIQDLELAEAAVGDGKVLKVSETHRPDDAVTPKTSDAAAADDNIAVRRGGQDAAGGADGIAGAIDRETGEVDRDIVRIDADSRPHRAGVDVAGEKVRAGLVDNKECRVVARGVGRVDGNAGLNF